MTVGGASRTASPAPRWSMRPRRRALSGRPYRASRIEPNEREVDRMSVSAESGGDVASQVPADGDAHAQEDPDSAPRRVIRVLLADDSYLVREAIAHVLETEPG